MKDTIKAYVIGLLQSYHKRSKQIELLHYELAHPVHISEDEMIDSLSLSRSDNGGNHSGYVSDKTLYIALNYQDRAKKLNWDTKSEISSLLVELESEQERLKYYVSLLATRQSEVLKLLFFEGYSQEECAQKLKIAARTVRRIKDDAIDALTELYSFSKAIAEQDCPKAVQ